MITVVKSIPIYYEEYGTGIPLLILHTLPGDHQYMKAVIEAGFQRRSGWRRIYLDLPGMGKTPSAGWINNHDDMFEVVSAFMQSIAPDQRFVIMGHSYGGLLAQGLVYWEGSRIDGVFLVNPAIQLNSSNPNLPPPQVLVENEKFKAALTPRDNLVRGMFVVQDYDYLQFVRTYATPAFEVADYPFLNKLLKYQTFSFPAHQLRQPSPVPALILTGRQDSVAGYLDQWVLLESYPRATYAVLDRAGHFLAAEQQTLFWALTNEWLNRVEEYIARPSARMS